MLTYSDPILSTDGSKAIFNNGRPYGRLMPTISAAAASGLQSWSQNGPATIIFSACRADISKGLNHVRRIDALATLRRAKVPHKAARGAYKGKKERCIIVSLDTKRDERIARDLAAFYGQESVLYIKADNSARLETPSGDVLEYLGKLVTVSKQEAKRADAYTKTNGCYYICKKATAPNAILDNAKYKAAFTDWCNDHYENFQCYPGSFAFDDGDIERVFDERTIWAAIERLFLAKGAA